MEITTGSLAVLNSGTDGPYDSNRAHAFAAFLIAIVVALGWWMPRDSLASLAGSVVRGFAPNQASGVAAGVIQPRPESAAQREQRVVAEFLARRYRVSEQVLDSFVATAYRAGRDFAVDPLLILAVAAIESRFNPVAESVFGAQGLMQIIPKFHMDKLKEDASLFDPDTNIQVGARILKEYLRRGGDLERALELYGGVSEESESQYASKVLAERGRLEQSLQRTRRPS